MAEVDCLYFEGVCDQPQRPELETGEPVPPCEQCPHVKQRMSELTQADQDALRDALDALSDAGYPLESVEVFDRLAYGDDTHGASGSVQ
jgi:hypothetical protein